MGLLLLFVDRVDSSLAGMSILEARAQEKASMLRAGADARLKTVGLTEQFAACPGTNLFSALTMADLVHQLITESAARCPQRCALKYRDQTLSYSELASAMHAFAVALLDLGLGRADRVAIYAEKRFETVIAMFGTAAAGGAYVPVNPLLKAEQVAYILTDCNVRVLVTSAERLPLLIPVLSQCPDLRCVVVMGAKVTDLSIGGM